MSEPKFVPNTVYVTYIASTPEKVWEALTGAEFTRQYFFGHSIEVEAKVGGNFILRAPDGSVHMSGRVIEYDPPRRLLAGGRQGWPFILSSLKSVLETGKPIEIGVKMGPPPEMIAAVKEAVTRKPWVKSAEKR